MPRPAPFGEPPIEAVDHLLIGSPTLESGIAWLEERTGVRAAPGGSHPGLGTWNALASLGPRQYLEVIAPDPGQPGVETFYVPGLRGLRVPRVVSWAARGTDLADRFGSGAPPGFACEPVRRGERVRPDGTRLAWMLAFPRHLRHATFDGLLPFFIEWETEAVHPGGQAPPGLSLRGFSLSHPRPDVLEDALRDLGLRVSVASAPSPWLRVELGSPRGPVLL